MCTHVTNGFLLCVLVRNSNGLCDRIGLTLTYNRIPTTAFESTAFFLAAYKTFQHIKSTEKGQHSLLKLIFRDSSIYFILCVSKISPLASTNIVFVSILSVALTNAMVFKFGSVRVLLPEV